MKKFALIISLLFMATSFAQAEELYAVLNGKAVHMDKGNYNENNWGLGFEYDLNASNKSWVPFFGGSTFKDSNSQTSNYIGGGYKYRIPLSNDKSGWRADVGVMGFLMTRKDYNQNSPFLGVLPFVSWGTGFAMINATYIPKVTQKGSSLFYFQLKFRVAEFD